MNSLNKKTFGETKWLNNTDKIMSLLFIGPIDFWTWLVLAG